MTSTEITMVSAEGTQPPGLSAKGDSGSPVFDGQGRAVGMLWGGDRDAVKPTFEQAASDGIHYVTPIRATLDHLQQTLEAQYSNYHVDLTIY